MELHFSHLVKYSANNWTIDEVVLSLQGQKKLLEASSATLERLIKGLEIDKLEIRVEKIGTGTLYEELVIVIYGVYQKEIDPAVASKVEKMFGLNIPAEYQPLASIALMLVALTVAKFAVNAVLNKKKVDGKPSVHIQGNYNTIVNIASDKLGITPDQVETALHESLPPNKRRSLIKSVTNFLRPKTGDITNSIEVQGVMKIPSESLAEYPTDSELNEIDDARNIDIPQATIQIRATDRDKSKIGWAAKVLSDKRFKKRLDMDLYPTIDAEELAKCDIVKADIVIEGQRTADGNFKPKKIHLLNFTSSNTGDQK